MSLRRATARRLLSIVAVPLLAAGLAGCAARSGAETSGAGPYSPSPGASTSGPGRASSLGLSSLVGPQTVPGGGRLRVSGTLPAAPSAGQPAYDLPGDITAAQVQRLGALLGLAGSPQQHDDSWVLRDAGHGTLTVATGAGHRWTLQPTGDGSTVSSRPLPRSGGADSGNTNGADSGNTNRADSGNTNRADSGNTNRASAAARTLLGKIDSVTGRGAGEIRVVPAGSSAIATAAHPVDGRTVVGFDSQIVVDGSGQAQSGYGFFGRPERAGTYRLVSAAQAVRRVPVPAGGMHPDFCVRTTSGAACAGQPQTVTGAHLGLLAAARADGGYVLVPAWLLTIDGQSEPLAVVAVTGDEVSAPSPSPTG